MLKNIKEEYSKSIKSFDTEENYDLCFTRPVGFAWALFFRKIKVTPNVITIISIFLGVAGGICFYFPNLYINIAGILLLVWAGIYDCTDGMLARLTGQKSELGRFLDGIAGDFWFVAIYLSIVLRSNNDITFFSDHKWILWIGMAAAAICHSAQAAVADRYRQMHLLIVNGSSGSELDSYDVLKKRYHSLNWKRNFFQKLYLFLYSNYTGLQERLSPKMEALYQVWGKKYPNFQLPAELRQEFRMMSFPFCKWENFMTYNWRALFLYTTVLIGYPWVYLLVELTIFNVVLVTTVANHEKTCAKMMQILEKHD
ncbi:MAG: CDP-alcohol phosphatidyltransferase family protein [Muribaculaceae bacterium]|nr:CDP-alcohol phosphatidyltransferase family protein [Muribaculaceae bacterium]